MAGSSTGKWVARAAATGGSRAYRGQRPVNWYLSLFLIVVLGITLIVYSRYEREHPYVGAAAGAPTTSDTWYVGFSFDICGKVESPPPPTPNAANLGITSNSSGIITVKPKNPSEAGHNATLGRYVAEYSGMELSASSLLDPGVGKHTYTDGERCAKGTPDAGKAAFVSAKTWTSTKDDVGAVVHGNPADVLFTDGQMITVGFLPKGAAIPKPQTSVIEALLTDMSAASSGGSTTTAPPTVSTPTSTPASTPAKTTTTSASGGGGKK